MKNKKLEDYEIESLELEIFNILVSLRGKETKLESDIVKKCRPHSNWSQSSKEEIFAQIQDIEDSFDKIKEIVKKLQD